jgi:hypothetical protein
MSALDMEGDERVRTEDVVEIIDCGRASERTKGWVLGIATEYGTAPFNWFLLN